LKAVEAFIDDMRAEKPLPLDVQRRGIAYSRFQWAWYCIDGGVAYRFEARQLLRALLGDCLWDGIIGGAETFTVALAGAMRSLGVDARVVFVRAPGAFASTLEQMGVPHEELSLRRGRHAAYSCRRLARVVASSGSTGVTLVKRGFLSAVFRLPPDIRRWALPIVTKHLFQSIVREAWFTLSTDPLSRRVRPTRAWLDFSRRYPDTLTPRRNYASVLSSCWGYGVEP